jgi:hypothetical protein
MPPDFKVTLDIAQIVMLAGLVWGLARMSKAVDMLSQVTDKLTAGLERIDAGLLEMVGRVSYLEGSAGGRRVGDRPR